MRRVGGHGWVLGVCLTEVCVYADMGFEGENSWVEVAVWSIELGCARHLTWQ
jgi:hypothetical protein